MTQHLLIFGGSGFIGQAICQEAVKQGIKVISCSPSGKPANLNETLQNPLITWQKIDIFKDTVWHQYFDQAFAVVNLIGILRENKAQQLTYQKMIVEANQLIADRVRYYPKQTYLFLSANAGGPFVSKNYLKSKRLAEAYLADLPNPVVIFRPGLVVGKGRPRSLVEGRLLYLLSKPPYIKKIAQAVYPIKVEQLARWVIKESQTTNTLCLTPRQLQKERL